MCKTAGRFAGGTNVFHFPSLRIRVGVHFEAERAGTAFSLLNCLRTHYGRHYELFSGQKRTKLQDFAYEITYFPGLIPGPLQKCPRCLDPDTNFGSPAFPLFLFYETTTAVRPTSKRKMMFSCTFDSSRPDRSCSRTSSRRNTTSAGRRIHNLHTQQSNGQVQHSSWDSYFDKICKLNNKILRILQNKHLHFPVVELYKKFNALPPLKLHEQQIFMLLYKFLHH